MTTIIKPSRFVGLHAHSTVGSIGDAIGLPQEHIDYALKNGMDGLALTDHGNMQGISHQQLHAKKLAGKGIKFKAIPGVEAYFIDSLPEWKKLLQVQKANKQLQKALASPVGEIGNEFAEHEAELNAEHSGTSEDEAGGTVIEIEAESKNNKFSDPIVQRNHLVLLPKNNAGLKALFQMVSESYIDGFYRYPRIDLDTIRRHAKGNVIASSACIGGRLARCIFNNQDQTLDWSDWGVSTHNFEKIQAELKTITEQFVEALGGPENYYLELQMNKLRPQHLVNYHLIELAKRTGLKLVMTVDSHYSNPDHWKEREVYKAMAWASKTKGTIDPNTLPQSVDELKCELYPKNADQLWDTYLNLKAAYPDIYTDDQLISDAIERTHDIAHNLIGDVSIDRTVKLPGIGRLIEKNALEGLIERFGGMSEDDLAFKQLVQLAIEGLKKVGRADDDVYIARMKYELETIKHLKFSKYFLTYHKIMDIVGKHMLIGNGRGSAAGSLLSYALNITQVDPIRFGLLWERFLVRSKKGYPDIDSDFSDRDKAVKLLIEFFGSENVIPVSNFAQLQLRSLIKDVARLHNLPFDEINAATGKIETEVLAVAKQVAGFDRGTWVLTYEDAMNDSKTFQDLMETYPEFQNTIKILFKQMRGLSRHAGGVIITENSREGMPLIKAGGELQTPWPEGVNFRHLEEFGLLKFDILGLGTLRIFENCVRRILVKQGNKYPTFNQIKTWFWNNLHPDNNPMDDVKVYANVFWNGNFSGIFQFINDKTQNFMQEMKPKSITDIAVATSIFRPGPLSLKVDQRFLNNRLNPGSVVYKHPLLREVFSETSGLLVFQEQLQMIYHKLAGVPLEETDGIRKAFTKKDISNKEKAQAERDKLRQSFIEACAKANQIKAEDCGEIFDEMEKLVAYSFNKSLQYDTLVPTYDSEGVYMKTKRIQDVVVGDYVRSRDESTKKDCFVRVLGNHDHGELKLVEVEFEDGSKVACTLDHKFRTTDGRMLPLSRILDEGLEIVSVDSKKEEAPEFNKKCGQCQHRGGRHSEKCVLIVGVEGQDYVKCSECGFSGKNLVPHVKRNHPEKLAGYVGPLSCSNSVSKRKIATTGRTNWVTKLRQTDMAAYLAKIADMSKAVQRAVLENAHERSRRSKLMADLWKTNKEELTQAASETAKRTSSKPAVLQARTDRLRQWREEDPKRFHSLCTEKMIKMRASIPEKALLKFLQTKFPEFTFKGGQVLFRNRFTTKSHRRQIDILSKTHNVIVEFDGPVHFTNIPTWNQLEEVRRRDKEVNTVLQNENYCVIRVSHDQYSYKTGFGEPCLNQLTEILSNLDQHRGEIIEIGWCYE